MKLNKELRAQAQTVLDWAGKPIVCETVAAALLAAALAIGDGKARRDVLKAAGLGAGAAAVKAAHGTARIAVALAIAAAEIAAARTNLFNEAKTRRGRT